MQIDKLLGMLARLLSREYDLEAFSFDFPDEMYGLRAALIDETSGSVIPDLLEEFVYDCAFVDVSNTGEPGLIDKDEFLSRASAVYAKIRELRKDKMIS